jgi:cytidylate kinase
MIVAIDGPAGAGKSTVAKEVARALGLTFLDTGAMYRAVTLVVLERGIHPSDEEGCAAVARSLDLAFDREGRIRFDGRCGEPDIRSSTVTLNVSAVSAHPRVRAAVVAEQRAIAERLGGVVAEGRDTTTVVFPQAEHKFFLNASQEERARRRALQEGTPERYAEILADIARRDRLDTTRAHSPLAKAPDALEIDADRLSVEDVVARILDEVRARGAQAGGAARGPR